MNQVQESILKSKKTKAVCAHCNQDIGNVAAGWLEYYVDPETKELESIRIVHWSGHYDPPSLRCMDRQYREERWERLDNHLEYFTGKEGLITLIEISKDWVIKNWEEFLDVLLTLHASPFTYTKDVQEFLRKK